MPRTGTKGPMLYCVSHGNGMRVMYSCLQRTRHKTGHGSDSALRLVATTTPDAAYGVLNPVNACQPLSAL
jgi:hypothetical protein